MWTFEPRISLVQDQFFKLTASSTAQFYNPFLQQTCSLHSAPSDLWYSCFMVLPVVFY